MRQSEKSDEPNEVEALRRVIDYAKAEAVHQHHSFTAYLLVLALHSLEPLQTGQRPS
jgi:hypothetical protein